MRIALEGLESDANYCVLLEMMPIGECRYKFSGSQWVPAGGAEPQSPQRMYLHPDSPASGAHWSQQPILFNKVKLTNNTLDNSGHVSTSKAYTYLYIVPMPTCGVAVITFLIMNGVSILSCLSLFQRNPLHCWVLSGNGFFFLFLGALRLISV
jgi:T-box